MSEISAFTESKIKDALGQLIGAELIFARGKPPDAKYVFKHALVRDAAYETLLRTRRQLIHARIANCLERRFVHRSGIPPETIASHYAKAGKPIEAIEWWTRAGNRALEQSANVEASRHFAAALKEIAALPEADRGPKELPLQIGLGSALSAVNGYSDPLTGAAYQRARQLAEELGDQQKLFPATYGVWNYEHSRGYHNKAREISEEMLHLAKESVGTGPAVAAYSALGTTLNFLGNWSPALENFRSAIELYDEAAHSSLKYEYSEDPCVQALLYSGFCSWHLGYPEKCFDFLNQAVQLASRTQHVNSIAYALSFRAILEWYSEDRAAAFATSKLVQGLIKYERLTLWDAMTRIVGGWAMTGWDDGSNQLSEIEGGIASDPKHCARHILAWTNERAR